MELLELVTFATVAREGAITRAANHLNTVQSNVTARIRLLEDELGVPLFHRHARGVTLTAAGERLLPYATRIEQLMREAEEVVASADTPRGTLRIGSLESTAGYRLPPVLRSYCTTYPLVDLSLTTGTTAELVQHVLEYRLEGALVVGPVNHPGIEETVVVVEELVLVAPPAEMASDGPGRRSPVRQLVLRAGCSYRQRLEAHLRACGEVVGVPLEFGTIDAIIGCVAAGIGVSLLPRVVAAEAERAGLVALTALPGPDAMAETVFIRRMDSYASLAIRAFVTCCQAEWRCAPTTHRNP